MSDSKNDARPGRMDADMVLAVARSLDCALLQLSSEKRALILETGLLRRARDMYRLVASTADSDEPLTLRTVCRRGHEASIVHWEVGGIATAGDCLAFEAHSFAACGSEVAGIHISEDERWRKGTMAEQPVTCPKCLALFRAASA